MVGKTHLAAGLATGAAVCLTGQLSLVPGVIFIKPGKDTPASIGGGGIAETNITTGQLQAAASISGGS